jgi:hypothetical protein
VNRPRNWKKPAALTEFENANLLNLTTPVEGKLKRFVGEKDAAVAMPPEPTTSMATRRCTRLCRRT